MLRGENDNLIQVTKEVEVVVTGNDGRKKRTHGLGRTLLGCRGDSSGMWHGTYHDAIMCSATTPHQCVSR